MQETMMHRGSCMGPRISPESVQRIVAASGVICHSGNGEERLGKLLLRLHPAGFQSGGMAWQAATSNVVSSAQRYQMILADALSACMPF